MLAALSGGEVLQQQQQQQMLVGLRKNPVRVAVTSMGTPEACCSSHAATSGTNSSSSSSLAALAARNLARATEIAEAAAAGGADLVVLAETFCCSGMTTQQMKAYAEDQNSRGHPDLCAVRGLAQRLSVNLAAGVFLQEGSYFRNAALFIDRSGRLLGRYYKAFPLPCELEAGVLPGEHHQAAAVLDTDLGRVGLAVGLDASWPQLFSGMASRGADLCVWLSASGPGLGLQALALSNGLPMVSGVMDNNAKVIAATGRVKAQTNKWERLVLEDLYIRDAFGLFTTYGQSEAIGKVLQLYGGRVRVEACEEENFWTIEAVDPTLKVPAIAQQLGLVTHADFLASCARLREDAAARKNEPPLSSSSASGRKRGRPPGAGAAPGAGRGQQQQQQPQQQSQQQQHFEEVASDDAAFEAVVFSQQ